MKNYGLDYKSDGRDFYFAPELSDSQKLIYKAGAIAMMHAIAVRTHAFVDDGTITEEQGATFLKNFVEIIAEVQEESLEDIVGQIRAL